MSYIGNSLAQGLVSGANIQDGTVDTPDLKDSSVTTAKIADGSITTAKIANDAVVTADIANDAVTTAKIAANAVSPAKMDFSAGSANALVYLNGSKVPTTSNVLTFDGSRLFLGTNAVTTSSSQSGEIYSGGAVGFLFTNSTAANYALSVKNEGTSGTRALVNFYEGAGGGTSRANIAFDGSNNLLLTAANSFVANVSQFGVGATPTAKFSVSIGAGNSGTVARFSAPSYDDVYVSAGASAQSCGIGTVSSSQFNIFVNGSSRVRVLNSGFMGVGVDPTCSLDASGAIRSREGAFVLNNGATPYGGLFTYNRISGSGADYSTTIFAETGLGINFCVNGSATKQSVLTSGGNWGFGNSTPRAPLDFRRQNTQQVILLGENSNSNVRVGFGLGATDAGLTLFSQDGIRFGQISFSDGSTWTEWARFETGGLLRLWAGAAGGNSQPLVFGSETGAPKKAIFLESYWLVIQGHNNEGIRMQTVDANGNATTRLTVAGSGAVSVPGSLSKGSGSFKIDHPHPDKSTTHHLVHSFIEGPKADLIYRGKVQLVGGAAEIDIDAVSGMTSGTFVLLCRDVQCFTSNESDWTPVRGAIVGGKLTIQAQDQTSTAMISWMVIGERKDQHMYDTDWTDSEGKVIVEPLKEPAASETEVMEG